MCVEFRPSKAVYSQGAARPESMLSFRNIFKQDWAAPRSVLDHRFDGSVIGSFAEQKTAVRTAYVGKEDLCLRHHLGRLLDPPDEGALHRKGRQTVRGGGGGGGGR